MSKLLAALVAVAVAVVFGVVLMVALAGAAKESCGDGAVDDSAPTQAAQDGIPSNYLRLYREAGRKHKIPWYVLAGIGHIETNHGRSTLPGVKSGANPWGAAGPMQIGIGGAASDNWSRPEVRVDGNGDGKEDVHDPEDAIPGAARYLKASGAKTIRDMVFAYNHADWYVSKVMASARSYAGKNPSSLTAPANGVSTADCSDGGGTAVASGKWKLAPGANRPGQGLTPRMIRFVNRMAGAYKVLGADRQLVLTTGTQHSPTTASGNPSDHWLGNGADFGMVLNSGTDDGPVGDRIATSAFMAAGLSKRDSLTRGRQGGAQTVTRNGIRVQIIWKVGGEFGNHHNHVHVGIADQ